MADRSDKSRGKPFAKGRNSHTTEVFRRGRDQLPRGNFTLFAKCVYHDEREALYQRCVRIARSGTNREVLALLELLGNRIEGLPVKKVEVSQRTPATFIVADGTDALPERKSIDGGTTPKAASPEDLVTLALSCLGIRDERLRRSGLPLNFVDPEESRR